jgi:hypothetical protein
VRSQAWWTAFGGQGRAPWVVIVVVGGALLTAIVLFAIGARVADDRHELGVELAKGGITLFAIAILGGALAAAFRSLDERRQEARRIDEYRAATADELWDAYHSIKAVRRLLVVAGFAEAKGRLSAAQCEAFHARMETLNDAQLTLEKLIRNVSGQPRVFDPHTDLITACLDVAESYLNKCIDAWEERGRDVRARSSLVNLKARDRVRENHDDPFVHLNGFLGPARATYGLKHNVSELVEKAAELIQALRFVSARELRHDRDERVSEVVNLENEAATPRKRFADRVRRHAHDR